MAPRDPGVRILLIDDDEDHRRLLAATLAALRLQGVAPDVVAVAEPRPGLDHLRDGGEWIVFVDHRLGTTRSTAWLPQLVAADAGPVIVITAEGDDRLVREVYRLGASGYLAKAELLSPDHGNARRVITDARRTWGLERRARELAGSLEQANAELRRRNARLGEVAAETQRFVDDVAHDLRGPLASIGCYAEMVATGMAGPVSDEQRSHLDVILRSATNLRRLVDDVLDGSRIRTGTVSVHRDRVPVGQVLERLAEVLAPQAGRRGVTVVATSDPDLPPAWADRDRVRRIVQNLASNAIRHGRRGTDVRLAAGLEGGVDGGAVRIAVTDRGPGIDEAAAARIFERFEQGRSSGRAAGGLGLGLAIAVDLARACLGRLELRTQPGEGSTFSLVLPVAEDRAVRVAAIGRWRADGATTAGWVHVLGATTATDATVRRWLADAIGTDGVVLPGTDGGPLRVGRPREEPDELHERLERARRPLASRHPAHAVELVPADAERLVGGGGPASSAREPVAIEVLPRDGAPAEPGPRPGATQML